MTPKPLLFTRLGAVAAAGVMSVPAYLVVAAHAEPAAVTLSAQRASADARLADARRENGSPLRAAVAARPQHRQQPAARAHPARAGAQAKAHPPVSRSRAAGVAPARRWLPTGTGMWTHIWSKTDGGDARRVLAHARGAGLSTIFVRTGSSHDGFVGAPALRGLLPRLPHTGVSVVAWDFPTLKDPVKDARRLARAARFGRTDRSRVMAVAPDIETRMEGTHLSAARVTSYLRTLRRMLPADVAILATTPWPSRNRQAGYPYATVARYADAFLPMTYWYDNSSAMVTARSMAYLSRFGRPVMPIGQGYDSRLDVPSLPASHPASELHGFFTAARKARAQAVSLWSWQTAGRVQWSYLSRARHGFPAGG